MGSVVWRLVRTLVAVLLPQGVAWLAAFQGPEWVPLVATVLIPAIGKFLRASWPDKFGWLPI